MEKVFHMILVNLAHESGGDSVLDCTKSKPTKSDSCKSLKRAAPLLWGSVELLQYWAKSRDFRNPLCIGSGCEADACVLYLFYTVLPVSPHRSGLEMD